MKWDEEERTQRKAGDTRGSAGCIYSRGCRSYGCCAFRMQAETLGNFGLHLQVETERHKIENSEEFKIIEVVEGNGWSLEISAPVYRPEKFLRMWSLTEGLS